MNCGQIILLFLYVILYLLVEDDLAGARANQIAEAGAHFAALANVPAHAKSSLHTLFNVEVTLIVPIFTHRNSFQTSHGAFVVNFTAKSFLGNGARLLGCLEAKAPGVLDALGDVGAWFGSIVVIVEAAFVCAGMEIGVSVQVVGVETVTHCECLLLDWTRAGDHGS